MSNEVVVSIVDSTHDLFEKEPCVIFTDLIELDIVVQFASLCQLHDNKNIVAGVQNLVKFDNVVVVDEF